MTDLMQQARELLAAEWRKLNANAPADELVAGCELPPLIAASVDAIAAALHTAPEGFVMVPVEPTREMMDAGRTAVMAGKLASQKRTPRQLYEASGQSMAGIPEDVLDERGPLTKESVAVMVYGAMLAARPQGVKDV